MSEPTALGMSLRTAVIMVAFTVIFTGVMALAYRGTKPAIDASAEEEKIKLVNEVLPPTAYDNALLRDYVDGGPIAELGLAGKGRIFRARRNGRPAALVFEAVAPDGYSGRIRLLVAVTAAGEVAGVRVVQHKETPGLGDYIDIRKDRNKARPWITQFDSLGFARVPWEAWKVKKDEGKFDQVTGATITARAVTNAVGRALKFADENRERIFALPAAAKLEMKGN